MAITLFDSKGRILLTIWALSLNGRVTGLKLRERASAIIFSRSMPDSAANFCATPNWIHAATLSLGWPFSFRYAFSPELELRTTSQP